MARLLLVLGLSAVVIAQYMATHRADRGIFRPLLAPAGSSSIVPKIGEQPVTVERPVAPAARTTRLQGSGLKSSGLTASTNAGVATSGGLNARTEGEWREMFNRR